MIATLLFLPWLPILFRQTGYYPGLGSPQSAWALVPDAVNVLSIGIATTRFGFRAGLAPFLALAAIGAVWLITRADRVMAGMLVLFWLLLPVVGIVALSQSRPLYEPRFLMLVVPAWVVLTGTGLVVLSRGVAGILTRWAPLPPVANVLVLAALAVVLAGALLVPSARSLASYYSDPAYARDDYRGLAQTVMLREQPGDAVVLTAPGQIEIFSYYYRGNADVFPLPLQRPIDPADTNARLDALAATHGRVWFVRWAANEADPAGLIMRWLEGRGRRIGGSQFGRVELHLYDLRATAYVPGPAQSR
jgi:hypothetical protein